MSAHVLVAYDDSPQAASALTFALEAFPGAHLTLLTVIDPADAGSRRRLSLPPLGDEWLKRAREDAQVRLDAAATHARHEGATADTEIEVGRPARTIVAAAEDHDVDHVVMGSHGRSGVSRILLGSVAEAVIRNSPVPVTVARETAETPEEAFSDGTPENESANDPGSDVSGEGSA